MTRGNQDKYNALLQKFDSKNKPKRNSVTYLMSLGYSDEQAKNAVHVYFKGGATKASFRLSNEIRNKLLDDFGGINKSYKDCVEYLMNQGCTYRQASSAAYKYRLENEI